MRQVDADVRRSVRQREHPAVRGEPPSGRRPQRIELEQRLARVARDGRTGPKYPRSAAYQKPPPDDDVECGASPGGPCRRGRRTVGRDRPRRVDVSRALPFDLMRTPRHTPSANSGPRTRTPVRSSAPARTAASTIFASSTERRATSPCDGHVAVVGNDAVSDRPCPTISRPPTRIASSSRELDAEPVEGGDAARRQSAAAGLVARERRAIEQQHARTAAREMRGRRRTSRARADDDGVVASAHRRSAPLRHGRGIEG